jgi:hypothetical protein
VLLPPTVVVVLLLLLRLLLLLGLRLLLLLLGLPLLVLLQFLRGEEDLDLLAIRARLHAVGLSLRGEVHLGAPAAAAAAAAAASRLARLSWGATGLSGGGAIALVGALVAVVIALVIHGGGVRAGIRRGREVLGVAVLGILAHGSYGVRRTA